ncbi:YeeE/YedE thiosulfate transporter family protein [Marinilabilia rubra]|uniref:Sulfurtransferase n=1 Tax=Marinilabilia rubra TaxID=2162893 RepID=A0A2U2BDU2_9BACT|nr:YeeE/YedE thiosulfate transporter family protein [Marinilabilia rubra]PWE01228.1 sulfurtransferase [Marinilabilia rubra]
MAPLIPDIIAPEYNYLIALIVGIGFGFALEQAGFSSTRKLVGLFYGYDFTVLRVFFTAGITAMTGVLILSHLELLNTDIIFVNPTFLPSALTGGVIMGLGFVIGGFCPGTSACAAAIGKLDGWAFILGATLGIFSFGEFYPLLKDFYLMDAQGPVLIYEKLGINRISFALIMTFIALFAFFATGIIEDKVNKRPVSLLGGNPKNKVLAAAIPVLLVLLVMVTPSRKEFVMSKLEAKAASGECKPDLIDADKLAFELTNNYYKYNVIDVRSPEEYEKFHIATAINIPLDDLHSTAYRQLLNQRIRTNVFYGASTQQAKQACLIARYHGNQTSLALEQTATQFQETFYGEITISDDPSKQEKTVANFRQKAAEKMTEIEENLASREKPVKKKMTRVQGGCS